MPACELHEGTQKDIDRLRDDIADIYGMVHRADAEIVALKMDSSNRAERMERMEANTEKAIAKVEGMIQAMTAQMHGVTSQLQAVANSMHKLTESETAIVSLAGRVLALEKEPGEKAKRRIQDVVDKVIAWATPLLLGGFFAWILSKGGTP